MICIDLHPGGPWCLTLPTVEHCTPRSKHLEHFASNIPRRNAGKGESDFDRLDVAELLLDRVLYNVQALAKVFQRTAWRPRVCTWEPWKTHVPPI